MYLLIIEFVKIKNIYIGIFLLFVGLSSIAQQNELETIRRSVQTGNTDVLSRSCDTHVEIITDKNSGTYSKNQAKFVLKEFFIDYPASNFKYLHNGSSPAGARYAVGLYSSIKASFRVYIKFRNDEGKLYIDSIQFTKE